MFNTAYSGLVANQKIISSVSDNLANAKTAGYKYQRMSYGEVVSTDSTRAASGEVGRGVLSTAVQRVNSQGAVVNSASPLDMAIEGDGFFAVQSETNGQSEVLYTRNGTFTIGADNYLTTSAGQRVLDVNGNFIEIDTFQTEITYNHSYSIDLLSDDEAAGVALYNGVTARVNGPATAKDIRFEVLEDEAVSTDAGTITLVDNVVYRGLGDQSEVLGSVTYSGPQILPTISFEPKRTRVDVETTNLSNLLTDWDVYEERVILGETSLGQDLAGEASTPEDSLYPLDNKTNGVGDTAEATGSYSVIQGDDGSLNLSSSTSAAVANAVIRGPALVSREEITLKSGDTVSFDWKAASDGRADAFAYLLNNQTGATIELLNQTAQSSNDWNRYKSTIEEAGTYQVVFVAGSYALDWNEKTNIEYQTVDFSSGWTSGNSQATSIDSLDTTASANVPAAVSLSNVADSDGGVTLTTNFTISATDVQDLVGLSDEELTEKVVRGPAFSSGETYALTAGQRLSFDVTAPADEATDLFAYLSNSETGETIELADQRYFSGGKVSYTATVPSDGNYTINFVPNTYIQNSDLDGLGFTQDISLAPSNWTDAGDATAETADDDRIEFVEEGIRVKWDYHGGFATSDRSLSRGATYRFNAESGQSYTYEIQHSGVDDRQVVPNEYFGTINGISIQPAEGRFSSTGAVDFYIRAGFYTNPTYPSQDYLIERITIKTAAEPLAFTRELHLSNLKIATDVPAWETQTTQSFQNFSVKSETATVYPNDVTSADVAEVMQKFSIIQNPTSKSPYAQTSVSLFGLPGRSAPLTISPELQLNTRTENEAQNLLGSISVDGDGNVETIYEGGAKVQNGVVGVARVTDMNVLETKGNGLFSLRDPSALLSYGVINGGKITSGAIEASNVEASEMLTDLIEAQMRYQANARALQASIDGINKIVEVK